MRKYLSISSTFFKIQLAWRFDVLFSSIFSVFKVLFAVILWSSVLTAGKELSGFTYETMLTYYLVVIFFSGLDMSGKISEEIAESVRNGTFSKYLVIPVKIFPYFTFKTVGAVSFRAIFYLAAVFIWSIIFKIPFSITNNPLMILSSVIILLLGLFFMMQLNYFLGLLSFKFIDIGIFLMIKGIIINFLTGSVIPLALLPDSMIQILKFLPFYHVMYMPSMLIIGMNQADILMSLQVILCWILFFIPLNFITYKKMILNYDGVGI